MQGSYDVLLVGLSIVTATIASFVALDMASRVSVARAARHKLQAWLWLVCGALAMGTGIWSMHFVGMLAFSLPVPLAYDIGITLASWLVAVASSALALRTVSRRHLHWPQLLVAGTLMGIGIAAMHYLGMEALQMLPRISYDPTLFAASVVFAIAAATAALKICFLLRNAHSLAGLRNKALSALVMGLAIAGMHYTGMAAANFAEGSVCRASGTGLGGPWLGLMIAGLATLFLLSTLKISIYHALPPTILNRLVFLVIASVTPMSLVAMGVMAYDYYRLHQQQERELVSAARAIMATVDHELSATESGLRVLSTSRTLQSGQLQVFHAQARDTMVHLRVSSITLESASGQTLMDTRSNPSLKALPLPGEQPPPPLQAPMLKPHVDKGDSVIVSVPLQQGVLLRAQIPPEKLAELLAEQQLAADWIVSVYDSGGFIAARSHEMQRFLGAVGLASVLKKIAQSEEGVLDTVTREGIPVLLGHSRSDQSGWSVAVGIPSRNLSAPLLAAIAWLLGGLAVILAGSVVLALRIGGSISSSVQSLVEPALALGEGGSIRVPPLELIEAHQVGRALSQASQLLDTARHAAYHDALTGLANRAFFRQMLQQQMTQAHRSGGSISVLYVDLDGFKGVNDTHGHDVGDLLLQQAADRMQQGVRACDVVARLGGDEFAIALIQPGVRGAAKVAAKLLESLSQPYVIGELRLTQVSASIGAVNYHAETAPTVGTCDALLKQADTAMYQAKQAGKRRVMLAEYQAAAAEPAPETDPV